MRLLDHLKLESVKAPLEAREKRSAIDELVDVLAQIGSVRDPSALKQAVWVREQTRTTGIGHGLAIPHGKANGLASLALAIGKPAEPMDFQAIDGKPVQLIVLLASPPDRTAEHIQALAQISRIMSDEEFRTTVYEETTAEGIYGRFREQLEQA